MKLIRGHYNLRNEHRGTVATIGNFDGVHRGHQAVIAQLKQRAEALGCSTTVITFEPLPHEHFLADKSPPRLTSLREKYAYFKNEGIDQMLCLPFGEALCQTSAEAFIQNILLSGLNLKHLVVGDDFRFGRGRTGDFTMLEAAGRKHGFSVVDTPTLQHAEGRISSTRIRAALAAGDLASAEDLLGRPYAMCGRVVHGDQRGRTIGFPTANIRIHRPVSPLHGVYAVEIEGVGYGVTNVGTRPTVDGKSFLIETHVLDFNGDLYGKRLSIRWLKHLRGEQKFESLEELKAQIGRDVENARDFFNRMNSD